MSDQRATFAHLLEMKGPAITSIAREMGVSPETARYWYRSILSRKGFALQGFVDEQKLGLRRVSTISDLDQKYWPYARDIFHVLNNYLGLVYYGRLDPSGKFMLRYAIPAEGEQELLRALDFLEREGIFKETKIAIMDWRLFVPMKSEYYNFTKGVWEFEWNEVVSRKEEELALPTPSKPVRFDYPDLLIAKELQTDSSRSVHAIATKLDMKYDSAFRHYHHILNRKLITAYKIRWGESAMRDPEVRSNEHRETPVYHAQHKYAWATATITGLAGSETSNLAGTLTRLPFLYGVQGGNGNLSFQVAIPYHYHADTLHFLREVLSPYRDSMDFSFEDQTFAQGLTFPFELFDSETGTWNYRAKECIEDFKDFFPKLQKAERSLGHPP